MTRIFIFLMMLLPAECFAQFTISGKVINKADSKPVANASVFLSNATIGSKTTDKGYFELTNIKPGKYQLIVSVIGFATYSQPITIDNSNLEMPDIALSPKAIALKEVSITYKKDPDRDKYYEWFKDEFLGRSALAAECTILNPEILNLDYDKTFKSLTASTNDFLVVENNALGYKIKYLLQDFVLTNKGDSTDKIHYEGPVLFEEMKGSRSAEKRWIRKRQETYENSPMHFLRAALSDRLTEEGFRVQKYAQFKNTERPPENLIRTKIAYYKKLKRPDSEQRDSLAYWVKKSKLPATFYKLSPLPLNKGDIIKSTSTINQYALDDDKDWLYVAYNKDQHFHISDRLKYLYYRNNTENTLIKFNEKQALFNNNGIISNPYSVIYYGVWGRNRVAEMLPVDYEPLDNSTNPGHDNSNGRIDSELGKYLASHPTEKAYLQFDKPYYATGDTIYFKAYISHGETQKLSGISGILHVDLINMVNKIDRSVKLKLDSGLAWGDFSIPDSLRAGNYRIRAYTQWMRNNGNYFEQTISIGSTHGQKIPESSISKAVESKPDLQFFPEGGSLINGIRSKIAFKAIGSNGLGMEAKGTLIDNTGKIVTQFISVHLGMGYFYIEPEEGKIYRANITFADGSHNTLTLPTAITNGLTLSINNDSLPKATVKIQANKAYYDENKGKAYKLLIYSGGMATTVMCKLDSMVISLDIIKRRLHSGITRVTLFSETNEPLSERLLFIQNFDQLNLVLASDRSDYNARGKVNMKLNAKDRADSASVGHFSVSVIDENKVPVEENTENTILTDLLLTSDLKGTVEQPNYYFTNIGDETLKNLDLVMLTHGYSRFEWKHVFNADQPSFTWQPERSLQISGTAKNLFDKPLAKAQVSLISFVPKSLTSTVADDNGKFLFDNLDFNDSVKFVLQAVNAKGRNKTKLIYNADKPPLIAPLPVYTDNINTIVPANYLDNNEKQQEELNKLGLGKGRMMKEVKIRGIKIDDQYETQSFAGAGHADQVMHKKEIQRIGGMLSTSLNGRLHGVFFDNGVPMLWLSAIGIGKNTPTPMLVIVDGVEMAGSKDITGKPTGFNVDELNLTDVETVEVLRYASTSIYGMEGANGVLIITTRKGGGLDAKDIVSTGILPITVQGYYKAREFYSPKYDSSITNTQPDLRSTIYWKPELLTDQDGHASFDFYNADGAGTYRVVIEGIDEKGNIGRQVFRYKVE